jgi:hypothetical protein
LSSNLHPHDKLCFYEAVFLISKKVTKLIF